MRVIDMSLGEQIEICNNTDCKTTFAYFPKTDTHIEYTPWKNIDHMGEPYNEMRYKQHYVICPECGTCKIVSVVPQLRKVGSKLYDDEPQYD